MKLTGVIAAGVFALATSIGVAQALPSKITIATEGAYAPWNFTEAGGKLAGFEVDLSAELCKRMKVECAVVAQDWDGIIPALNAKKYDAIMAGMNSTPKRREAIAFSRSYGGEPSSFGAAKDGPLAKLPDAAKPFDLTKDNAAAIAEVEKIKPLLKGKIIGAQVGTIQADFLNKYLKDTVTIREYKTTEQHDLDLAAGRVDGIFANTTTLQATFGKPEFKDYSMVGPYFRGDVFGDGVSIGLRKGDDELKAAFNKAIDETIHDGTLKALSIKWFKRDITPAE
jgi:octopine/nopaline transport system substrate-binding protein